MTTDLYRQVELQFVNFDGRVLSEVSWVPARYAEFGAELHVRRSEGWTGPWRVTRRYGVPTHESLLPDPPRDFRRHKRGTGGSLPKERT